MPPQPHLPATRRHGSAPPECHRRTSTASASSCIVARRPARRIDANTRRTASRSGATVSTALCGNSRAAARFRRSCTRCWKPRTACSGVANTAMPASARRRREAAPVVSPMAQTRRGTFILSRHSARAAIAGSSAPPMAHGPPARRPRLECQPRPPASPDARRSPGSTWTMSDASCSPWRSTASAAMRPAVIALVMMLSASLRTGRARARISAAASRSSSVVTQRTPARRSAASKARSVPPLGSAIATARLDGHHRPQPRRSASRREERAAIPQLPDVEQDRAGAGVARQPVQHKAEADIRACRRCRRYG